MTTSITTMPMIVILWTIAIVAAAMVVFTARRTRLAIVAIAFVLAVVATASSVNGYFDYIPTVGALFGHRARDEASWADVRSSFVLSAHPDAPLPPRGKVILVRIPGAVSHFRARAAQVYLPPVWFASSRPRLPVIELLSGTPGTPEDWTRAALADVAVDAWAAAHHGVAPILVMPDANGHFTGDTECVDGSHGRAETYLTTDVAAWMTTRFRAAPGRNAWVIGGASEGGYCALDLALRHPYRYATFLDFSGLDRPTVSGGALHLFRGSQRALQMHSPRVILTDGRVRVPMAGWFEVGSRDGGTTHAVQAMADLSRRAGIDTHIVLLHHAHHTWRVWRRCFADALPWTALRLGLAGHTYAPAGTRPFVAVRVVHRHGIHRPVVHRYFSSPSVQ